MVPLQRNFYVAAKFFHSRVAERNPEITAGHVFQFMSLIEDHCAYIGQNACIGRILRLLLDRQVGKKQMMIDDDDVAFHRPPMHFSNKAPIPFAAFLPETRIRTRVQFEPKRTRLRQRGQFRTVSGRGCLLPRRHCPVLLDFFQSAKHRLSGQIVKLLAA